MPAVDQPANSLKFGTSGLRGLVTDLVGEPSRLWTAAFLTHLDAAATTKRLLLVGRDLRSSSPRIAADCMAAALAHGWDVGDCGDLPTPALALAALTRGAAAVMVTGSHIPDDRNGLKFYAPGEITKSDEEAIRAAYEAGPKAGRTGGDAGRATVISAEAAEDYRRRYTQAFASDALTGLTVGVYQQSSVARDLLTDVLAALGADTVALGRSDIFMPVDTEAHRPEDLELLSRWSRERRLDALVSTDGDADRPLVATGQGDVLRGDVLGLIAAAYLKLGTIVTPVTSSAAVETSGIARKVVRTRVGSPYVIEGMETAVAQGNVDVLGFEANGGVLLGRDVVMAKGTIAALPTRDAFLPILCALATVKARGVPLGKVVADVGAGHALADRLQHVPAELSAPFLTRLASDDGFAASVLTKAGAVRGKSTLDGVRFDLDDGSVIHYRASGNAPELRCYVEAPSEERARHLLASGLDAARQSIGA